MIAKFWTRARACIASSIAATALLAMSGASAQIASGTTGIDASGNAKHEMAACKSGMTQQDRATCMREAENAQAARKDGKLKEGNDEYAVNALKRCDALTGENRIACQARISGYGDAAGSVAGGGVIREVETVVVPADGSTVRVTPKSSSGDLVVIPAKQ